MATPAPVSVRGWGWRHAGRLAWAVRDLELEIPAGQRVLLLGASGAGKSTLLHALAGVLGGADEGDEEGAILVAGRDPRSAPGSAGLVLQDPDSQVVLSRVGDDVAFGCENLGVPTEEIWGRVRASLAAVGLHLPLGSATAALSGGQKQRLALAGVLAMRPGLLLLDEPTANLDPDGVTEVRDAVRAVAEASGATLLVVEHRVSVWRDLVDRVVVLGSDGVLADGDPSVVLAERGRELAAAGVWVPGHPPPRPARRGAAAVPLLTADGLTVARPGGPPLGGAIDFCLEGGRAMAVTGPNGSGKTTLGLTVAGLIRPASGRLTAEPALSRGAGVSPVRWRSRELLSRIGTVFQDPEHQFLAAAVRSELEVGPRALGLAPAQVDARVDALLQRLRLAHLAAANPFTLSGGEKRRLSVATVLASEPSVLVLDEPTFGQDSRTWAEMVAILTELLDQGTAVLAVSHDEDFVDAVSDVRLRLGETVRR